MYTYNVPLLPKQFGYHHIRAPFNHGATIAFAQVQINLAMQTLQIKCIKH